MRAALRAFLADECRLTKRLGIVTPTFQLATITVA